MGWRLGIIRGNCRICHHLVDELLTNCLFWPERRCKGFVQLMQEDARLTFVAYHGAVVNRTASFSPLATIEGNGPHATKMLCDK